MRLRELTEKRIMIQFDILQNPLGPELVGFLNRCVHKEVRGLVDPGTGNVFCWDANSGLHLVGFYDLVEAGMIDNRARCLFFVATLGESFRGDAAWSQWLHQVGPVRISMMRRDAASLRQNGDRWSALIRSLENMI